jgi:Rps23 Pro-64 3,4-dihydroxylase Tpa1-like proline 4-hydroxylase
MRSTKQLLEPTTVANAEEPSPPFCVERDFLGVQEMDAILAHALAHADTFGDATVSSLATLEASKPDYRIRRSHISDYIAPLAPILIPRLQVLMPRIWPHFRLAPITYKKIEFELAYHGDEDFFKTHTDNGLPDIAHRRISLVYYFHREPRQFSGGNLRIFNTLMENGIRCCGTGFVDIEAPHNGLIVFPSDCYHEVTTAIGPFGLEYVHHGDDPRNQG